MDGIGKAVLLVSVVLALVAAPAWVQDATPEPSAPPRDDGSLYRGAYEVTEDGALVYGGDVEVRCKDLVNFGAPAGAGSEDPTVNGSTVEPLTREAVELCVEAGFPPEGVTLNDSPGTSASREPGTLPETGGTVSPLSLGMTGILVAGSLLTILSLGRTAGGDGRRLRWGRSSREHPTGAD